ncbi:hypothetical protein I4U23_022059 [Adineta vaga]|nr:hypothetical protein I4U23_022059 [Adineta vaga]
MSSNNNTKVGFEIFQLQQSSRYVCLIFGFILLLSGVIGNIFNMIIFFMNGYYNNNASSFYMLVRCFLDLNALLVGLVTRILSTGFSLDLAVMNRGWCKVRSGFLDINTQSTYTLLCLQSIDAFICSSPSVVLRQKSNIRIARYLVIGTICFWFIHELPYYFLQDLVITGGTPACVTKNTIFAQYRSYFIYLGVYTSIPIVIISIFGFLTVKHMRITAVKRSLTALIQQMIMMALFQIFAVLIFNGPYTAGQIYFISTANSVKSAYQRAQEQLVNSFFAIYGYGPYAVKDLFLIG